MFFQEVGFVPHLEEMTMKNVLECWGNLSSNFSRSYCTLHISFEKCVCEKHCWHLLSTFQTLYYMFCTGIGSSVPQETSLISADWYAHLSTHALWTFFCASVAAWTPPHRLTCFNSMHLIVYSPLYPDNSGHILHCFHNCIHNSQCDFWDVINLQHLLGDGSTKTYLLSSKLDSRAREIAQ